MIKTLSIKNYAIIESVDIEFSQNLTIITGETGAGKSIMMGALGLIMGKRADTKVLYDLNNKCVVEAVFEISEYRLQDFFKENDIDYSDETVVRREISTSGKTRAFVNDTPVNLDLLRNLTEQLVDLHQQFDTLDIQKPEFQLKVIDALADNKLLFSEYQTAYKSYESNKRKLNNLKNKSLSSIKENDFLAFQLKELEDANLREGELSELENEQKQLSNAEDIKRALQHASNGLTDDEMSIVNVLSDLVNEVNKIAEYHPKLPKLAEKFEGFKYELEELSSEFQDIADDTEYDGARLSEIEQRLDLIYRLQKKHYVNSEMELIKIQWDIHQKVKGYANLDSEIAAIEKQIQIQEKSLFSLGKQLSEKRQASVVPFQNEISVLLEQLSMKNAQLKVEIIDSGQLLPEGTDTLRFLFAANKGGRLEEIKGIASGGEMSRLALCIKSLVASAVTLPTLIFDEIDSGVSGEVALQMGIILQELSKNHQVISITHSPQIAAKADRHYFVHKMDLEDRTITGVRYLNHNERVLEIAKMLSGDPPTDSAKQNALELLSR
jgi:DNA repair protein RecN (Recombination protein N)